MMKYALCLRELFVARHPLLADIGCTGRLHVRDVESSHRAPGRWGSS
jgi:hypothetical protein